VNVTVPPAEIVGAVCTVSRLLVAVVLAAPSLTFQLMVRTVSLPPPVGSSLAVAP